MIAKGLFGFWSGLLSLCFLLRPGLAQVPEPAQCLVSGIYSLIRQPENIDDQSCYQNCFAEPDCHLAVVNKPLSGPNQCLLINCLNQGQHSHPRDHSAQIKVYPKSTIDDEQRARLMKGAYGLLDERLRCHQLMNYSSCQSGTHRFFYNSTSYRCEQFFSGCGFNRNTFDTVESCEALCSEKFLCYRPMERGEYPPIRFSTYDRDKRDESSIPNFFFYNVSSWRCEAFHFRGSLSNGNIFRTVEDCEHLCGDVKGAAVNVPAKNSVTTTSQPAVDSDTTVAVTAQGTAVLDFVILVMSILLLLAFVVITVQRCSLSQRPSS